MTHSYVTSLIYVCMSTNLVVLWGTSRQRVRDNMTTSCHELVVVVSSKEQRGLSFGEHRDNEFVTTVRVLQSSDSHTRE